MEKDDPLSATDTEGPDVPSEQEESGKPPSKDEKKREKLQKKLQKLKNAYDKKGIVYISRIPPHMKPQKLRHMLSQHGEVGRVYLAPEDAAARKRRKKMGKNTGKNFSEGWVEFEDKKVAKQVAAMLNGNPMGGKRRSAYHYDLWCLKYLPKFKWDHLSEEIAYQKAVREQRLAAEISAAKRERDFYLSRVDKAKAVAAQQERKRKRQEKESGGSQIGAASKEGGTMKESEFAKESKVLRAYSQKRAKVDPTSEQAQVLAPDVLALIAGRKK
ncbi:Pre-rRNA-processing protein esf2 [Coccomyxa sp. Obi]|nr:Pre-rRNA-processing protein esf2 [Coccomyxa sp. Obi]